MRREDHAHLLAGPAGRADGSRRQNAERGSLTMTQIAASIEYETAPPPVGLPDDMRALPGARLSFLSIKAIDGFAVAAALWQPEDRPPADTTLLVQVHGSGEN